MNSNLAILEQRAALKPCGTIQKYKSGCRCKACKREQGKYRAERRASIAAGDKRGFVPTSRVITHILALRKKHIGTRMISETCGIHRRTLQQILAGERQHIRADKERAILAVDATAVGDATLVKSNRTRRHVEDLLERGFSKSQIARWLGYKSWRKGHLDFLSQKHVQARTALKVELMVMNLRAGRLQRA